MLSSIIILVLIVTVKHFKIRFELFRVEFEYEYSLDLLIYRTSAIIKFIIYKVTGKKFSSYERPRSKQISKQDLEKLNRKLRKN